MSFTKPLFDSEEFAFIGAEGWLYVHCRKCACEASVELESTRPRLRAVCPECGMQTTFEIRNASFVSSIEA